MVDSTVVDHIIDSLAFEVEAVPQDDVLEISGTSKATPVNLKIRVRKKDEALFEQGVVSVPKLGHPNKPADRIRLVRSDQTVLSFKVFVDTQPDPHLDKKPARKRKRFFGGCLSSEDNDEETYVDNNLETVSKSNDIVAKNFGLSKTENVENMQLQPSKPIMFLGNRCKPGGCLDPPRDEDIYSYKPREDTRKEHLENKKQKHDILTDKIVTKTDIIDSTSIDDARIPPEAEAYKETIESDDKSVQSIFQADYIKSSIDTYYSNSIITYPLDEVTDDIIEKPISKKRTSDEPKKNPEFRESFFIPPKSVTNSKNNSDVGKDLQRLEPHFLGRHSSDDKRIFTKVDPEVNKMPNLKAVYDPKIIINDDNTHKEPNPLLGDTPVYGTDTNELQANKDLQAKEGNAITATLKTGAILTAPLLAAGVTMQQIKLDKDNSKNEKKNKHDEKDTYSELYTSDNKKIQSETSSLLEEPSNVGTNAIQTKIDLQETKESNIIEPDVETGTELTTTLLDTGEAIKKIKSDTYEIPTKPEIISNDIYNDINEKTSILLNKHSKLDNEANEVHDKKYLQSSNEGNAIITDLIAEAGETTPLATVRTATHKIQSDIDSNKIQNKPENVYIDKHAELNTFVNEAIEELLNSDIDVNELEIKKGLIQGKEIEKGNLSIAGLKTGAIIGAPLLIAEATTQKSKSGCDINEIINEPSKKLDSFSLEENEKKQSIKDENNLQSDSLIDDIPKEYIKSTDDVSEIFASFNLEDSKILKDSDCILEKGLKSPNEISVKTKETEFIGNLETQKNNLQDKISDIVTTTSIDQYSRKPRTNEDYLSKNTEVSRVSQENIDVPKESDAIKNMGNLKEPQAESLDLKKNQFQESLKSLTSDKGYVNETKIDQKSDATDDVTQHEEKQEASNKYEDANLSDNVFDQTQATSMGDKSHHIIDDNVALNEWKILDENKNITTQKTEKEDFLEPTHHKASLHPDKNGNFYERKLKSSFDNTFDNNENINEVSDKYEEQTDKTSNSYVKMDIGFHSFINDNNERVIKTLDTLKDIKRQPQDYVTIIKSQVQLDIPYVINVPVDNHKNITLEIKATDYQKPSSPRITGPAIRGSDNEEKYAIASSQESQASVPETESFQNLLGAIYENHMLPLQTLITDLRNDVDVLAAQQMWLKENLTKSKRGKSIRLTHSNKKCVCVKKFK